MKKVIVVFIMLASIFIFNCVYASSNNYPEVYNLHWSNRTAKWSVDGKADKYEVRLYRDDRRVYTKTQTTRSRSFSSEMSRGAHEYYFEVRPYNSITGWGEWDQSDSIYVEKTTSNKNSRDTYSYGGPAGTISPLGPGGDTINTVPSVPSYSGLGPGEVASIINPQEIYNPIGQWVWQYGYWRFLYTNGVYASNSWLYIGNKWYYIDINTNMVIGFKTIGQGMYYFYQDGSMAIGTVVLNGVTHYFDNNGKMVY